MDRDAHYYAILAFCRASGFSKESAQIVAYASQYVDDAAINLMYLANENNDIEYELVNNRPAFFNMATCHSYFRMQSFNYEAMVNNTLAFHFVPGCQGANFPKKLRCKEESPVILDLLNSALESNDLIQLGIVLHVYVDTYSHQGFSGILSKVNRIKNCQAITNVNVTLIDRIKNFLKYLGMEKFDKYLDLILPPYGHSQALKFPDLPYLIWSYEYDYSDEFNESYKKVEIDNRDRYKRAFTSTKNYLQKYLLTHSHYVDDSIQFDNYDYLLDTLILKGSDREREENWRNLLIDEGLFSEDDRSILFYDRFKWLEEAFSNFDTDLFNSRVIDGVELADNFAQSHWYGFYQAVKWYKKSFFDYCAKYELEIPN